MVAVLDKVTAICLELPEASVERSGSHATYRVRKKVFAYFLDNHHGDGIVSVPFKAGLGENQDLVKHDRSRFYLPAYIGARGWAAVRLDRPKVPWKEVEQFIRSSYFAVAPKKLRAML
jgi:predicted DNA-binding protein (MmcQ/YjbR family)